MRRFVNKLKCDDGFSLVEVLLAIVLLAIVAVPLLQVVFSSMKLNLKSKEILAATDSGSAVMEYLQSIDYTDIKKNVSDGTFQILNNTYNSSSISELSASNYSGFCDTVYTKIKTLEESSSDPSSIKRLYYQFDSGMNGFALTNLRNDSKSFDLIVSFNENNPNGNSDYFVYDIYMEVYCIDSTKLHSGTNYSDETFCVSLNGSVMNVKSAGN